MTSFPNALSPLRIGQVTIPNRIVRTAHVTMLGMDAKSGVSERLIAYHEARARGGVGLTILEICSGHPSSPAPLMAINPGLVEGYRQLVERIRPHGMRLFQQLWHGGHHAKPLDGSAPWSASDIPSPRLGIAARPMTRSMITEAIDSYVLGAGAARKGGIDGVEVHAAHGYLIQQFLSPITNRRTDDYGGPLENRMRLLLEVLAAVREEVGAGFPVGMEAARIAALRGHEVILCEADKDLGGKLRLARKAPFRAAIGDVAAWLESKLFRLGVQIDLSTYCDSIPLNPVISARVRGGKHESLANDRTWKPLGQVAGPGRRSA